MKINSSACNYGAEILNHHINSMIHEIDGAVESVDIEHIHQLRVNSRRIRSTLPLFSKCFNKKDAKIWQRQIREVTKSLGETRDTDVQIEKLESFYKTLEDTQHRAGLKRLTLRLQQKRENLQNNVIKAINSLSKSNALNYMQQNIQGYLKEEKTATRYPLSLYLLAHRTISDKLDLLQSYDQYVADVKKVDELHDMRIAAKNMRYTMEVFLPLYASGLKPAIENIREAQEILGDIHDLDVWMDFLPKFLEEEKNRTIEYHGHSGPLNLIIPGIDHFYKTCLQNRQQLFEEFNQKWFHWKEDQIWEAMLKNIQLPTYPLDAVILEPASSEITAKEIAVEKAEEKG